MQHGARLVTADGKEIASFPDFQHNRTYYDRSERGQEMVKSAKAALQLA